MKAWIIVLIVVFLLLFVIIPGVLVAKIFKVADIGYCGTKGGKWGQGCDLGINEEDCNERGGKHFATDKYDDCKSWVGL